MPRNYPIRLHGGALDRHYAMIGMAHIQNDYPLYYDAVNEKGLCIAGLNFVGNAVYPPVTQGVASVPQYALIPWLLGTCATVAEARNALARVVVDNTPFAPALPCAQLHWLVADRSGCIVVEATADGLHVYDDPAGVLTNNPAVFRSSFGRAAQLHSPEPEPAAGRFLRRARHARQPRHGRARPAGRPVVALAVRARGVRARQRPRGADGGRERQPVFPHPHERGAAARLPRADDGQYEITLYSSCCNADRGIYYYTTYDNRQITGVKPHAADLDSA